MGAPVPQNWTEEERSVEKKLHKYIIHVTYNTITAERYCRIIRFGDKHKNKIRNFIKNFV